MAWILDTYLTFSQNNIDAYGCVTGKPVTQSGIRGRVEATGRGVFYGTREAVSFKDDMKTLGLTTGIDGKTVVVQGLGNVGYHAARIFQENGAVIVGLAEYEGAIHNPKGLDVEAVMRHRKETGSILNFAGATNILNSSEALELECDILIPAAIEHVIHTGNAPRIKAKIIAEAANGPITAEAEEILLQKKIMILPDVYLNAGGVTVSYFEWLKNLSHVRFGRMDKRHHQYARKDMLDVVERLTGGRANPNEIDKIVRGADEIDIVRSGLEETMIGAYQPIRELWRRSKKVGDLRTSAFAIAIDKVAISYLELGIFP